MPNGNDTNTWFDATYLPAQYIRTYVHTGTLFTYIYIHTYIDMSSHTHIYTDSTYIHIHTHAFSTVTLGIHGVTLLKK